jgi:hypothetical protein
MTLKYINLTFIFLEKFAFKSIKRHIKSLALWKSECLGSDPKLDPKLFTSRIRIRNYFLLDPDPKLGGKWDPDLKKIFTDPQH